MSNSIENKKVLKATNININNVIAIEVDASSLDFKTLQSLPANDKGNRTVLYEKWIDESTGITMQLTGYVTGNQYTIQEGNFKNNEALRIRNENEALKLQVAQMQTLLNTPEMQELLAKLAK